MNSSTNTPTKPVDSTLAIVSDPKTKFAENVRKWVAIDTQIRYINEKAKTLRDLKHDTAAQLCDYITTRRLEQRKIEITDGELKMFSKTEYQTLTFTYVEECLDKLIPNKEHVQHILKYMKENRNTTVTSDIRRTFSK